MFNVNSDSDYMRYYVQRPEMFEAMNRWGLEHVPPGDFLTALLSNDLVAACGRADMGNQRNLHVLVKYAYNELPSACWGSLEKVKAWAAARVSA